MRINSLSQDPVSAGENVLLLNQIQQDDSFTQSSSLVSGKLQVADSALGSVVSQLTQAISLATSANNGTMNPSNVKSIANQIQAFAMKSVPGQYQLSGPVHFRRREDIHRALHHFYGHLPGRHNISRRSERQLS